MRPDRLLGLVCRFLIVVIGVSTVTFIVLRLSGDPALLFVSAEDATPERLAEVRRELGFEDPILVQYFRFMNRAAHGDFGISLRVRLPALPLAFKHAKATLVLAVSSLGLAVLAGFPAGVFAAVRRNSPLASVTTILSLLGQCMPVFWLGILLVLVFAVNLRWLPSSGGGSLAHLILPSVTLGAFMMARISRLTRSSMLDVLNEDYIRTARGKGLSEQVVVYRHALKNAAIPAVASIVLSFSVLMGGAIVTENLFAWPGLGRLLVSAVTSRDYPLAQACIFVIAVFVTVANLAGDTIHALLDPTLNRE